MENRNLTVVFLIVVVGLLVWQGVDTHPVAVAAPSTEPAPTGSISVSGSSAIRVQPDRVVVLFGVETFASTPSAAQAQNARQSRADTRGANRQASPPQ